MNDQEDLILFQGASLSEQLLLQQCLATRVTFHWWGRTRRVEGNVLERMVQVIDAEISSFITTKKLYNLKLPALQKLTQLRNKIGAYWEQCTLPYVEPGIRLLRKKDVDDFNARLTVFQNSLSSAATDLQVCRSAILEDARQRLQQAFDLDNYPANLASLFQMEWSFPNIMPPDYLAQLSPDIYERELAKVQQRFQATVTLAESVFCEQFAQLVEHLAERLTPAPDGTRKIFHDSTLANLEDFFTKFSKFNFTKNNPLDDLVQQAKGLVNGTNTTLLRNNVSAREDMRAVLHGMQDQLDQLMINKPRRRIQSLSPVTLACAEGVQLAGAEGVKSETGAARCP